SWRHFTEKQRAAEEVRSREKEISRGEHPYFPRRSRVRRGQDPAVPEREECRGRLQRPKGRGGDGSPKRKARRQRRRDSDRFRRAAVEKSGYLRMDHNTGDGGRLSHCTE